LTQIVLGVLVVVIAIVTVDTLRTWRRRRTLPLDAQGLVTQAIRRPNATDPRVWRALDSALLRDGTTDLTRVWRHLERAADPTTWRPKLATETEWRLFSMRWGNDYGLVANPAHDTHFRLEPWETELLPLMDGTRTVAEIIVERFGDEGDLNAPAVVGLVQSLHEGGFLDPKPLDTSGLVRDRLDPASSGRRKLRLFAKTLRIDWAGADRFVRLVYGAGLKYLFTIPVAIGSVAIALGGLAAFFEVQRSGEFTLGGRSPALDTLVLIALSFVLTGAHELGHALVEVHRGRRIGSAGFMIYFGSPAFFVDASDGLMMDRWWRIAQSFAGPWFELVLAGIASLILYFFPGWGPSRLLYRFALLNLFVIFMNLIPLLELDGYWIFADLIQVPDLRPRSLAFVQHDLWHKVRTRDRLSVQEWGLALYGVGGVLFTIFSLVTAFYFWREIFGGLVTSLWEGGPASRLLLILLGLFLAGPLVRGSITLARTIWRRGMGLTRKARFRLETKWRVEAAELIDALPAYGDLPEEILSDLAGRVQLVAIRPGQPVFRQGARADALYVVRIGSVTIETEHPETGDTQVLRVLRRGEAFGELGLLQAAPRTATARANGEVELFRIDKGTFDRLLADATETPEFGLTLEALAELRELPAFAQLASKSLSDLLDQGAWVTAAPGDVFVAQGEEGDAFYAIASGHADVLRDGEVIGSLSAGDHFGETALLTEHPRNATVRAHTPVRAFRLSRAGFDAVIAGAFRQGHLYPPSGRTMGH
jgi:CRP-like cAMP-binding protein/Zn-dependent protease